MAVWDAAGEHLLVMYGFSIIDIVKHNPKENAVHFGGIKGQAIRQRYIDTTYDTLDKDGNVKTTPLSIDINVRTQRYTFCHPNGPLFATQFTQIALVVTEKTAFDDMRSDSDSVDLSGESESCSATADPGGVSICSLSTDAVAATTSGFGGGS